jgi:hypothetical protein
MKCCVPSCVNQHKSSFIVPKSEWEEWEFILGIKLKKQFRVCGSHFNRNDIIDTWESGQGFRRLVNYYI